MTITQTAVIISDVDTQLTLKSLEIPQIGTNEVLVENKAIGLNPIDWKSKKYNFAIHQLPWINGRESSGKIVEMGSNVKGFNIGDDVILASTSYRDLRTSTFQNYSVLDHRLVWKLPDSFSYEDGATIGVGLITAAMIFYDSFGIDYNEVLHNEWIIIWGASSVVGLYLIQLAKLHGLKVIGIANKSYDEYLKQRGVDILIDKEESVETIHKLLSNESIKFGVDCVSEKTSDSLLQVLERFPGSVFSGIVKIPKRQTSVIVCPVAIKKFHEDIELGRSLVELTSQYLQQQKVQPVRIKRYYGLELIETALTDLEIYGARAEKYVVSI